MNNMEYDGLPAPCVEESTISSLLDRLTYSYDVQGTSTFCHAFLDGRFYLATGHSACVAPENYDNEIGHGLARDKAYKAATDKLWELEGYVLYKKLAV